MIGVWQIIPPKLSVADLEPIMRITDALIADPPVSPVTGLDLITVTELAPGGRSQVVFTDDYGGRKVYVLTDFDPEDGTFGLRQVG